MRDQIRQTILTLAAATIIGTLAGVVPLAIAATYGKPGPRSSSVYVLQVSGSDFEDLAMSSSKTFDAVNVGGYNTALVEIAYTYNSGTAITMTCDESPDNATWFTVPQADESSPPTVTFAERTWTWTVSASVNVLFEVPVRYRYLKCTIAVTGGAASDTITATMTAAD